MSQLQSLGSLMVKSNKMRDQPHKNVLRKDDVFGETDQEAEDAMDWGDAAQPQSDRPASPIEAAVLQLTKIVGGMARQGGGKDLEALLNGADCTASSNLARGVLVGSRKPLLTKDCEPAWWTILSPSTRRWSASWNSTFTRHEAPLERASKLCPLGPGWSTGQKSWTILRPFGRYGSWQGFTTV